MISDLDIYRSDQALIQQHGNATAIEAAMNADAMLDKSDMDGAAVWFRIIDAVHNLQREVPRAGETRH